MNKILKLKIVEQIEGVNNGERTIQQVQMYLLGYARALEDSRIISFEEWNNGTTFFINLLTRLNSKIKPYSENDKKQASLIGLDLDNWTDYVEYYQLGE
jgi:hypothetical protein